MSSSETKNSASQQTTCHVGEFSLNKFVYSSETGLYTRVGEVPEEDGNNNGVRLRHLRPGLFDDMNKESSSLFAGTALTISPIFASNIVDMDKSRLLDEQQEEQDQVVYGRRCICASVDNAYCPVGAELCRIVRPNPQTYRVQCEGEVQGMIGRFLLPLMIFMLIMFVFLLMASPKGKYARGYIRKLLCCWREERYEQELQREIGRMAYRNYRLRQRVRDRVYNPRRVYYNHRGEPSNPFVRNQDPAVVEPSTTEDVQVAKKIAVGLKTRSYTTHETERNNECAICLSEFVPNERVGKVKCGHIFHVEPCLKSWIVRKNHCPLCKSDNLATLHGEEDNSCALENTTTSSAQRTADDIDGGGTAAANQEERTTTDQNNDAASDDQSGTPSRETDRVEHQVP